MRQPGPLEQEFLDSKAGRDLNEAVVAATHAIVKTADILTQLAESAERFAVAHEKLVALMEKAAEE